MNALKPTCDRKTKFWKNQKNTFGLLPGPEGTCPHATTGCGGCWQILPGRKKHTCYVDNTMAIYKGVEGVLKHNTRLLEQSDYEKRIEILNAEFARFRTAEMKQEKPQLMYRIHWSGDIFDASYALALAAAINHNNDIKFWCYTRSFFAIPILANIKNLNLYLSLDPVNMKQGLKVFEEYKTNDNNLQICYMGSEHNLEQWKHDQQIKLRACPVDTGKLVLENGCANCGQCTKNNPSSVWFRT